MSTEVLQNDRRENDLQDRNGGESGDRDRYGSPNRGSSGSGSGYRDGGNRRYDDDRDHHRDPRDTRDTRDTVNKLANTTPPSRVLGVFGLHPTTNESDLLHEFRRFGPLEKVTLIMDRKTNRSKCFAFIYFDSKEDAINAKDSTQNLEIQGRLIRTDFSASEQPHDPTPGRYQGQPHYNYANHARYSPYGGGRRSYDDRDYGRDRYNGGGAYRDGGRRSYDGDRDRYNGGGRDGGRDRYSRDDRDRYDNNRGGGDRHNGRDSGRDDRYRDDRYSSRDDRDRYDNNRGGSSYDDRRPSDNNGSYNNNNNNNDDRYSSSNNNNNNNNNNSNGFNDRYRDENN